MFWRVAGNVYGAAELTVWCGSLRVKASNCCSCQVLADCLAVWSAMQDKEDMRIRIPHDGYLKVWQLRKPSLQKVVEHEVLLLDEGQDMNPTMLDVFMRQATTRVIVGEPLLCPPPDCPTTRRS